MITKAKNGSKSSCPLAVYVNWKPYACEDILDDLHLQQQLINIMGAAVATDIYEEADNQIVPKLPLKPITRTLKRYAVDAVAATIEEGPKCFGKDAAWKEIPDHTPPRWWSSDNDPMNAVSRFSRQLRTHMNKPENKLHYVGKGREVVALGVALEYLGDFKDPKGKHYKICMMGRSLAEEQIKVSFGNHQVGAIEGTTSNIPPGDWSEVRHEFFLTFLLAMAVYMIPHRKFYLDMMKDTMARGGKALLVFQVVLLLSCVNIMFAMSLNPESKEQIGFGPS
ncbi:MAG: hypothetical protein SGILL_007607 [Bacillariaceae sp.]